MKQKETIKPKTLTSILLLWSIAGMALGVAGVLFIRYQWAVTSCGAGRCDTLRSVAGIVQPFAILMFFAGLTLMVGVMTKYFMLRRKQRLSQHK